MEGKASSSTVSKCLPAPVIPVPVRKEDRLYKMNHPHRGNAIIFNHKDFDKRTKLSKREGTDTDRDQLKLTLTNVGFKVTVYNDLTRTEIDNVLLYARNEDHSEADTFLVAVMTHGSEGAVYARDIAYPVDRLWNNFTVKKCPTLAGKPKIFLVQSCRGSKTNEGARVQPDGDSKSYKLPNFSDVVIAYSTIPGYLSWRDSMKGSWFMQGVCQALDEEKYSEDLLSILTEVCRKVSINFENGAAMQTPCISSMLTRKLFF